MLIDKESWHYRFMRFWGGYDFSPPRSLCAYFWTFVFTVLKAIGAMSVVTFLVTAIPLLFWSWLANGSHVARDVLIVIAAVIGLIATIVAAVLGYAYAKDKVNETMEERPASGVAIGFGTLIAIKRKVCPLISYNE